MRCRIIVQTDDPDFLAADYLTQAMEWVLIKRFDIIKLSRHLDHTLHLDPTLEFGVYYDAEVVRVAPLPPLFEKLLGMRPSTPPEKIITAIGQEYLASPEGGRLLEAPPPPRGPITTTLIEDGEEVEPSKMEAGYL